MAGDQGGTIIALEFQKFRAIDNAGNDFTYIERRAWISRNHTQEFFRIIMGIPGTSAARCKGFVRVELSNNLTTYAKRVSIIFRCIVTHTRDMRVHLGAAQCLVIDILTYRHLDQGWAAKKDF